MNKIQIAIDPGKQGSIAYFLNNRFCFIRKIPLIKGVIDTIELKNLIKPYSIIKNLFENENIEYDFVYYMEETKVNWVGSKKSVAEARGLQELIRGMIISYEYPYYTFPSKAWQKFCWTGITPIKNSKGFIDTKTTSYIAFQRIYPQILDVVKTKTKQGFDDGMVDAILIGYYGITNY